MRALTEAELVADTRLETGESPLWDPSERRLYFSDVPTGEVLRFEPELARHEVVRPGDGEPVGGMLLDAAGGLVLLREKGRIAVLRDGTLGVAVSGIPAMAGTRFNDAIADAAGRIYAGTMPTPDGRALLLRIDTDGAIALVHEEPGQGNGLAFGVDGRTLYWTNTRARRIVRFDYDPGTGELSSPRTAVDLSRAPGVPDGLVVDAEGALWSALWGEGAVVRLAPDGREIDRIGLSAKNVASVAFGGDELRDLYVTTGGGEDRAANGPGAGALFRARVDVPGLAQHPARLRHEVTP